MNILFRKDNEKEFVKKWKAFLDGYPASYRYLPRCLDYMLTYSTAMVDDLSFVALRGKDPVGICFLPVEERMGRRCMTASGGYVPAPLASDEKVEKEMFAFIDGLAREHRIAVIRFYLDPLVMEYREKFNNLLAFGYMDTSSTDGIIDLRPGGQSIFRSFRENHRRSIKKIMDDKALQVVLFDFHKPDYKVHETYRKLHRQCAGRVTRGKKTFDLQFAMLKNDEASLFGLKKKRRFIGFLYFFHQGRTAVYASGSDDPEYGSLPVYHVLIWRAVQYYKNRGFEFLQLARPCGFNRVDGFGSYLDAKQINISHFKRGFGTKMVPLFRGVKYFDKAFFLKDADTFKNNVMEAMPC